MSESSKETMHNTLNNLNTVLNVSNECDDNITINNVNNATTNEHPNIIDDYLLDALDLNNIMEDTDALANYVFTKVEIKIDMVLEKFPRVKKVLDESKHVQKMLSNKLSKLIIYTYELTSMILVLLEFVKINKKVE